MPSHFPESEAPPAEAVLIRRAREARGLSPETAAQRLRIKLSGRRWRQLEEGREHGTGKPAVMGDAQLAHMAHVVGVGAEQLDQVGRGEAAAILREIERQEQRIATADAVAAAESPEVPEYVDLDACDDWEREVWERLFLTSPEDKLAMVAAVRGRRRRAEQVQQGRPESDSRRRTV